MAQIRSEGEREGSGRNSGSGGGAAIAGGEEHAGERGTRPTGHSLRIREHQGIEGVKGTTDRPIKRPKDAAEAVVAMAGDAELSGVRG